MYYSYSDQISVIEDIYLKENQTKRIDCPFCLGKNTFTISNIDGDTVWNCYKASCFVRGFKKGMPSTNVMKRRIAKEPKIVEQQFKNEIPEILSDPLFHPEVVDWLEKNNCLSSVRENKVNVKYSPKERRILFFYPKNVGATGRTLIKELKPKWKIYGDTSGIFILGEGNTAVVVEDCPSAVSVARLEGIVGIALGGTNITSKQKHLLGSYNNIYFSLDKDISSKSLSLTDLIKPFTNVTIKLLEKDLKRLNIKELQELFGVQS